MTLTKRPGLVLLHGWAINKHVWDPILPVLSEHFEVHLLDLPGYGHDVGFVGGDSLDDVAKEVLDRAPDVSNWVAWSLGGTIAVRAANLAPRRIKRLQLISTTPRFMVADDWTNGIQREAFEKLRSDFRSDFAVALKKFLLLQCRDRSLVRTVHQRLLQHPLPDQKTLDQGLDLLADTKLENDLKSLPQSVQIIAGIRDRVVPIQACRELGRTVSNLHSIHELESGHLPFLEASDEYISKLLEFFTEHA